MPDPQLLIEAARRGLLPQGGPEGPQGPSAPQGTGAMDVAVSAMGGVNQGIAQTVAIPIDALNYLLRGIGIPNVRQESAAEPIQRGMESLGIQARPKEGTAAQRVAGETGRGVGGGMMFGPQGIIPGAVGGAAAGLAKEAGASPATQIGAAALGGLAGGGAMNLAGKTAATMAGAQGTQRLQNLRAEGVTPRMVGDVTGSRAAQGLTAGLQNAAVTGGIVQRAAQQTTDEIAAAVERAASRYGAATTPTQAGQAVEGGIKRYADRVKTIAASKYQRLHQFVPVQTPVTPTNTQVAVADLTSTLQGLPKTAEALTPSLFKNLADDLAQNATPSFAAMSRLRTELGKKITDPWLIDDISRGEAKRLYAALTLDLRQTAANISPRALREFDDTAKFYKERMDFVEDAFKNFESKGVTPEKMFQWAVAEGKVGATRLADIKRIMKPDEFGLISSTVLRRLGTAGQDKPFDTNTFLREWDKLSPDAKTTLFDGRQWGSYRQSVDRIAEISRDFRETGRLANTSRTAGTAQLLQWLGVAGGAVAGQATIGAMEGAAAAVGVQAVASKLMTSERFARWLATPVPMGGIPKHVSLLAPLASREPEIADALKEFTAFIAQQGGAQETGTR